MTYSQSPIGETPYKCGQCGYDLTGSVIGGTCPECGTSVRESLRLGSATHAGGSSSTATAAMVLGIISVTVCGLLGPVAIVLYYQARAQVAQGTAPPNSMSMAKAGLILGWISTVLIGLVLIFYAVLFALTLA